MPSARHLISSPQFAARARDKSPNKRTIARWAADMVKDGDAIFLDDSTTYFGAMRAFVRDASAAATRP